MTYASASDVAARLGRPLTADEQDQVATLLADAELLLKSRIPDLADQVTEGTITEEAVVYVTANAVKRVLKNPDGYTSETDGDYTYELNWRLLSSELDITDREWSLLGVKAGISLITLKVPTPYEDGTYITDPENPLFFYAPMFWEPL